MYIEHSEYDFHTIINKTLPLMNLHLTVKLPFLASTVDKHNLILTQYNSVVQ